VRDGLLAVVETPTFRFSEVRIIVHRMAPSASRREEGAGIEMGAQPRLKDPSDVPVRVRLYGQVALLTLTTPGR
jgi:hypothetical protein